MVDFCHYQLSSNTKYHSVKIDQIEIITSNINRRAEKEFIFFIIYQLWLETSSLVVLNRFPNKDSLTFSIGINVEDKYIRNTH